MWKERINVLSWQRWEVEIKERSVGKCMCCTCGRVWKEGQEELPHITACSTPSVSDSPLCAHQHTASSWAQMCTSHRSGAVSLRVHICFEQTEQRWGRAATSPSSPRQHPKLQTHCCLNAFWCGHRAYIPVASPLLSPLLPCMRTCITKRCIHGTLSMETISACQLLGRVVWKFSCHFALYGSLPWMPPSVKDFAVLTKTENEDLHTPTRYCLLSTASGKYPLELNLRKWLLSRQKQRYWSPTFSLWHVESIIPALNLKISPSNYTSLF